MRFQIEAAASGGLRILDGLPEGHLVALYGRNGIGKTMAVRLLQLATGEQPFTAYPAAWQSLREALGPVTITAHGHPRGLLEWRLEPSQWPDRPENPGGWLGTAQLAGRQLPIEDVPALLRVHRVGGDETLSQSLAEQVSVYSELVTRLFLGTQDRQHRWESLIDQLRGLISDLGAQRLQRLAAELEHRQAAISALETRLIDVTASAARLVSARETRSRFLLARDRAPQMQTDLAAVVEREAAVKSQLTKLDETAVRLFQAARASRQVIANYRRADNLYRLRRERHDRRRRELARYLEAAGIQSPESFESDVSALRETIEQLRLQRRTVDRVGIVIDTIGALERPLAALLRQSEFATEVVAELDEAGGGVTAEELQRGLNRRATSLTNLGTDAGRDLQREIAALERKETYVPEARRAVRLADKAEEDVHEAKDELDALAARMKTANKPTNLSLERDRLLDELVELHGRSEDLRTALLRVEGVSVAQLSEELGSLSPDRMDDEDFARLLRDAALSLHDTEAELSVARNGGETADEELRYARRALSKTLSALRTQEDWSWLREGVRIPEMKSSSEQAAWIDDLHEAASSIGKLLVATRNDQDAITQAISTLADRLRSGLSSAASGDQRFLGTVTAYMASQFESQLSAPEVREALFDGGREVRLDLNDLAITWTSTTGESMSRPLEAFSSGERAFAYTRLQLERAGQVPTEYRVVVLDEFGAFIARDRRDDLYRFIRRSILGTIAQQIIVILPLVAPLSKETGNKGYVVNVEQT